MKNIIVRITMGNDVYTQSFEIDSNQPIEDVIQEIQKSACEELFPNHEQYDWENDYNFEWEYLDCNMKNIRVYNIKYLYLTDDDYFHEYNSDNEMTEEEIEEHVSFVKEKSEVIFKFDNWYLTKEQWNNPELVEQELVNMIEEETSEYFKNFEWEYLDMSN